MSERLLSAGEPPLPHGEELRDVRVSGGDLLALTGILFVAETCAKSPVTRRDAARWRERLNAIWANGRPVAPDGELLTFHDVSEELECSLSTVRNMVRAGRLKAVSFAGSTPSRITRESVRSFLDGRRSADTMTMDRRKRAATA